MGMLAMPAATEPDTHITPLSQDSGQPDVSHFSREQAVANGELVDVTYTAQYAGFNRPVMLSCRVWRDCVEWTNHDNIGLRKQQHEFDRLWDLLSLACLTALNTRSDQTRFTLYRVPRFGRNRAPQPVTLDLILAPGDEVEPEITIKMPDLA